MFHVGLPQTSMRDIGAHICDARLPTEIRGAGHFLRGGSSAKKGGWSEGWAGRSYQTFLGCFVILFGWLNDIAKPAECVELRCEWVARCWRRSAVGGRHLYPAAGFRVEFRRTACNGIAAAGGPQHVTGVDDSEITNLFGVFATG